MHEISLGGEKDYFSKASKRIEGFTVYVYMVDEEKQHKIMFSLIPSHI